MLRVLAISDLHGFLPEIPECELLLLGGDYCRTRNIDQNRRYMLGEFSDWLKSLKARYIVGIGGNHDFILQEDQELARKLPWVYLQDEGVELEGIQIYGSPWTPPFYDWAFMQSEDKLRETFKPIPHNLDILLTHGPAYRCMDRTQEGVYAGSFSLMEAVKQKKPDSHVFGHIHEGRGISQCGDVRSFNVSHVTRQYEPKHAAVNIPLSLEGS